MAGPLFRQNIAVGQSWAESTSSVSLLSLNFDSHHSTDCSGQLPRLRVLIHKLQGRVKIQWEKEAKTSSMALDWWLDWFTAGGAAVL